MLAKMPGMGFHFLLMRMHPQCQSWVPICGGTLD